MVCNDKKTLKKFVNGKQSLDQCFEQATSKGVNNGLIKRIKKFREQILDPDCKKDLRSLPDEQKKSCSYELKKIKTGVEQAIKALDDF